MVLVAVAAPLLVLVALVALELQVKDMQEAVQAEVQLLLMQKRALVVVVLEPLAVAHLHLLRQSEGLE